MPNCPFCLATLSEDDIQWGMCHRCNQSLPEVEIDRIRCTYNEPVPPESPSRPQVELPAERPEDARPPVKPHERPVVPEPPRAEAPAPIEVPDRPVVLEAPQEAVKRETADEDRTAATVADRDAPPDIDQRVSRLWEGRFSTDATPMTSIKADSPSLSTSDLAVPARNVCDTESALADRADYLLLGELGKGGMGVVFAARQATIDRTVALKMLPPDTAADPASVRKFLAEAVVTGELEHPNIVPIYDAGADQTGAMFYSMKQVEGTRWDHALQKKTLTENLEILMKVTDAVAYAHSKDVLHRDLKPENVMIAAFGEVLVMDWGLAVTTQTKHQVTGVAGSPAYMPPEMATGRTEQLGPASDIYLLGAILFEIITGRPPHHGQTVMECLQAAARNQIVDTPDSGELLEVAKRALADRPEDRYGSVAEFQKAIRSYQSHSESIILSTRAQEDLVDAQQTDNYEMFARALFRFREARSLWNGNDKAREGITETGLAYAECALAKGDYDLGASVLIRHDPQHAALLRQIETALGERNARQRRLKMARRLVGLLTVLVFVAFLFSVFMTRQAVVLKQVAEESAKEAETQTKQAEKNAKEAETEKKRAERNANEADSQREQAEKNAKEAEIQRNQAKAAEKKAEYDAYISRIGLIATKIDENAFDRARELLKECPSELRDWEWGRLNYLCSQGESREVGQPIEAVAVSSDGKRFAVGGRGTTIHILDAALNQLPDSEMTVDEGREVFSLAFSPDGMQVAAGTNDQSGYLKIYDSHSGERVRPFADHKDAVVSVAYSKDGKILTGSYDKTARLYDLETGEDPKTLKHESIVWSAAISSDGQRIITGTEDGTVGIWNGKSEFNEKREFLEHLGPVYAVAHSPSGSLVASGGRDQRILLWNPKDVRPFDLGALVDAPPDRGALADDGPEYHILEGHTDAVRSLQFSSDGKLLVSSGDDNTVRVWDVDRRTLIETFRGHGGRVPACAFVPGSKSDDLTGYDRVFSGGLDGRVVRWSVPDHLGGHDDAVLDAAFSPDGKRIVTAGRDRTAIVWNTASDEKPAHLKEGHKFLISSCQFFPDGTKLLTAAMDNAVRIWDTKSGGERFRLEGTGLSAAAAISGDGRWILTGSSAKPDPDAELEKVWHGQLWTANGQWHSQFKCPAEITAVALSHDGSSLLTGDAEGYCRLWDYDQHAEAWNVTWNKRGHSRPVTAVCFAGDEEDPDRVLTASADNTVSLRSLSDGTETMEPLIHAGAVASMSVGQSGNLLLTTSVEPAHSSPPDGDEDSPEPQSDRESSIAVRLWDLGTGEGIELIPEQDQKVRAAALSPDGKRAALALALGDLEIWNVEQLRGGTAAGPEKNVESGLTEISSVAFDRDGKSLAVAGGAEARILDLATEEVEVKTRLVRHAAVASANISPDGKWVVTGGSDGCAKIWDRDKKHVVHRLQTPDSGPVRDAVFSPDSKTILVATDDKAANGADGEKIRGTVRIWNVETGKLISPEGPVIRHKDRIRAAAFSPDGSRVVTGSDDMTARIWNAETGEVERILEGHEQAVLCAAFSDDGNWVITGGDDNVALIWNVPLAGDAKLHAKCAGHTAGVVAVAFAPDGLRVITGSRDKTARIWDPATAREILALKGHNQELTSASFSPDGRRVLTSSRDGTAIVWPANDWEPE